MKLVHDGGGAEQVLARDVDLADSFLAQARGLMFTRSIPDDYALAFRFDSVGTRDVHMVFVPFPLDVIWTVDAEVRRVERLSPWTGIAKADADALYELPAGAADGVNAGDRVELRD